MPEVNDNSQRIADAIAQLGPRALVRDPLRHRNHGYLVGGPAAALVWCESLEDLAEVSSVIRATGAPWSVLGVMSNSLVADRGIDRLVVRLNGSLQTFEIHLDESSVTAGGGIRMPRLAVACNRAGLAGVEWMVGVPGTIGGAVTMNAGIPTVAMEHLLVSAEVFNMETGEVQTWDNAEFDFRHRHSVLLDRPAVVVSAKLQLAHDEPQACKRRSREVRAKREATQPLRFTTGSVFTNKDAWTIVDRAGFRSHQVGCARVSDDHTNFIVIDQEIPTEEHRATHVHELMCTVRDAIRDQFDCKMDVETTLFGFTEDEEAMLDSE